MLGWWQWGPSIAGVLQWKFLEGLLGFSRRKRRRGKEGWGGQGLPEGKQSGLGGPL